MEFPGLPGRAMESLLQFLEVFLVCTVALVPRQPEQVLAGELLIVGVFFWIAQLIGQIRYLRLRVGHPWSWFVYRFVLSQLGSVPFVVVGIALLVGSPSALYWLTPGFVFSFAAGIVSAWVLLVEILR